MASGQDDQTLDELFLSLRATGDVALRTALIERHLPLARNLAGRYRYTPQPLDDLVQVASLGLVKAVDAFDPGRGVSFAAFAVPTIVGELKRHMRDAAWAVHVPRALKERVLLVERAERALLARSTRPPTVSDLARESGLSDEEVLDALNVRLAHDASTLESASPLGPRESVDDLAGVDDRLVLSAALRRLRPRERTILRLRLVDGLTQSEIGVRVGLSQMYVSRLLRATLETLRAEIEGED
jgi:RNA polymerase sigma-B factor